LRSPHGRQREQLFASVLEPAGVHRHFPVLVRGALVEKSLSISQNLKKPLL
jgi:hypothetical protein